MSRYSKTMLPPILKYTYRSFLYEDWDKSGIDVSFDASLSVVNNMSQVDHIQVRMMSLNSDRNGLNEVLFPEGMMFLKPSGDELKIEFNTVKDGKNIFSIGGEDPYATSYRIQIRVVEKGADPYKDEYDQSPPDGWVDKNTEFTSEWSNSAIVKTVKKPSFGLYRFEYGRTTVFKKPDVLMQGWYSTYDKEEPLVMYRIDLYGNGELLETSSDIYIKEHEKVSIHHKFQEVFVNDVTYTFVLVVQSATGYVDTIEYDAEFELSFVKLFNIVEVHEDQDTASTEVKLRGFQANLKPSERYTQDQWLADKVYNELGENGFTHFRLESGNIKPEKKFSIPYNNFVFAMSFAQGEKLVCESLREALRTDSSFFNFTGDSDFTYYSLHAFLKNGKEHILLKEERRYGFTTRTNLFTKELEKSIEDHETAILVGKNQGETIFEVVSLHKNEFK